MPENLANDLTIALLQQLNISDPNEIVNRYYETLPQVEAALKNRSSSKTPEVHRAKVVTNLLRV